MTHAVATGLAIAALPVLVVAAVSAGTAWHVVSFSIFGATLVLLYLASTLYHSIPAVRARHVLKTLDHCAIFLLIAGTYTPFMLVCLRGPVGWTIFGTIWGLAAAGVILKCFFVYRFKRLSGCTGTVRAKIYLVAEPRRSLAIAPPRRGPGDEPGFLSRHAEHGRTPWR